MTHEIYPSCAMAEDASRFTGKQIFDYVVVGSGSAGSTIAARLAEHSSFRVALLEAGPSDQHIYIRMPAALGFPLMNDRFNWYYTSEPDPNINGRTILEARGRVLGGSSSINGMNWVRGNPWDYDNWGGLGAKGWSYASCLPYFRRAETFDKGANAYRGGSGPMKIETSKADGPLYEAFLASGQQMGLKHVDDHNAFQQEGVHITQRNIHKGVRCSTYEGYIRSQPRKGNLSVFTNTRVTRVEMSNKRVVRVHCVRDGQYIALEVERETILCGGAINSPQLLQLSGIGNADDLRSANVTVTHHLAGVGYGLKDHVAGPIMYRATKNVAAAKELTPYGKAKIGLQWLLFKKGYGATNFFEVGTFMRTRDSESVPNVQFEFVPMLGEVQHGNVAIENGFQYYFSLMRPKSSGRVWIGSADPMAAPKFAFNYLQESTDLEQCVEAVKAVRDTIRQKAWDDVRGEEVSPGPSIRTDDEIRSWLKAAASTNYHPCCSCRMGDDEMSVVDASGKVRGVDALRVVDASIMPEIVSGNLNAPIIMMAEKIADDILGLKPLPLDPQPFFQPH